MTRSTKNIAASVLARLKQQADRQGVPYNHVLQFYAMERFLYRLSQTKHVDSVFLKGALLLKVIGIPRARPTMDIDLLKRGAADRSHLVGLVKDCIAAGVPTDGIEFDASSVRAEDITVDADYQGSRVLFDGRVGTAKVHLQIDFGVGDAMIPGPRVIEYPVLLDSPPPRLNAYPIETSIAEKFQAMVELDTANSRMKDFYDLWVLARHIEFDGSTLASALRATFDRRQTPLPVDAPIALTPRFFADPVHQRQWQAFVRRIGEQGLAERFAEVCADIAKFIVPPSTAASIDKTFAKKWPAGGPWREG